MNTDSNMGKIIALGGNLENPREAKATDWPSVGPSGPEGSSSGDGKLVTQTQNQEGPRHSADSGPNTPSVWGEAGKEYPVSVSKGEGGTASTAVKCDWSVDFSTGQTSPNAMLDTKY